MGGMIMSGMIRIREEGFRWNLIQSAEKRELVIQTQIVGDDVSRWKQKNVWTVRRVKHLDWTSYVIELKDSTKIVDTVAA